MFVDNVNTNNTITPSSDNNVVNKDETAMKASVFLEDGVLDVGEQEELLRDVISRDSQLQTAEENGADVELYIERFLMKAQDFIADTKEAGAAFIQRISNYVNNVKIHVNDDMNGNNTVLVAPESVISAYQELQHAEEAESKNSNIETIDARDAAYDKFSDALSNAGFLNTDTIKIGNEVVDLHSYFF